MIFIGDFKKTWRVHDTHIFQINEIFIIEILEICISTSRSRRGGEIKLKFFHHYPVILQNRCKTKVFKTNYCILLKTSVMAQSLK